MLGRASSLVVSPWSASHWGVVGWWMRTPCPVCASASAAHVLKHVSFSMPALTTPCLLWPWFSGVYLGVLYLWRHAAFRGDVSGCHILWIWGYPNAGQSRTLFCQPLASLPRAIFDSLWFCPCFIVIHTHCICQTNATSVFAQVALFKTSLRRNRWSKFNEIWHGGY